MFNGYNETPLISYEFNQDRVEKKQENGSKWSYGHEPALQPPQSHPANRQPEFWPAKPGFVGLSNAVKCTCTGCYPTSENQSYQGDTTRHRPWLPRTFPVPLNGTNDPCKLPPYQWENGSLNQGSCYSEASVPFVQEAGGKHAFYRHYQESNQPGVITSLKNADFGKKQGKEETSLHNGNGMRQAVFCNPVYNLGKRADGRNYCDPSDKYSNAASFTVDQHIPRLPVVEPYIKAVPSNLSENRVPSTGYRSVKENLCQSYVDGPAQPAGYGDSRKVTGQADVCGEKRNEAFPTGGLPSGAHVDFSHFGRDLSEAEPQKWFFDNVRHSDYYSRKNLEDVLNRNNQSLDNKKDCAISQIGQVNLSEQYNVARSKYPDPGKPSCEAFYPKDFDKTRPENHLPENSQCFQRNEDKNENANVHARLPRSAFIFNDPRFADKTQNSFPYPNNPTYRNYGRPEYPYQGYNAQHRYEYAPGLQRNDFNHYRPTPHQTQPSDQCIPQQQNPFFYEPHSQQGTEKTHFYPDKNLSPVLLPESLSSDSKNPSPLEPVRSEGFNKNGTSKISPLRLLRKKKFINVPHEPTPMASTLDAAPGLDVRKFWSTWAEEEEENVAPTQMVVLDCQDIDPEQAKLLHLYETDPVRAVHLESGSIVIKDSGCTKGAGSEVAAAEEMGEPQEALPVEEKGETREESNNSGESKLRGCGEMESKAADSVPHTMWPSKSKMRRAGGKKDGVMDKWTEKKFDFLKRSEESKAAEILRQEEEKKKIFETRLSLQQSLKKTERPLEKMESGKEGDERMGENMSPSDENSQSSSAEGGSCDVSDLPTSEYRRNKFLDYSERKVIVNGRGSRTEEDDGGFDAKAVGIVHAEEIKKESIKVESGHSPEKLFPLVDDTLKDEPRFEMDDILQKMSEINFQSKEMKSGNGTKDGVAKKPRSPNRKVKKKKSDHQPENEQRTDKLTLETVKFSIQKSHDLKISFKVLNNSKNCSEEERGIKDAEVQGNSVENSKNSTELITLSYKSIQRDGDRRPVSESKKSKRRFRRKKNTDEKTPVLKIKKSRYMLQPERDPLGNYEDEDDGNDSHVSKNPSLDECPTPNDFHVHETVDSAKIKLTFKRHKTNFETQYKINDNNTAGISELEPVCEDPNNDEKILGAKYRKKSVMAKEKEVFAEAGIGVESCPGNAEQDDGGAESTSGETELVRTRYVLDEDAKNSTTSRDSYEEEKTWSSESGSKILSDAGSVLRAPEDGSGDEECPEGTESGNDNLERYNGGEERSRRRKRRKESVRVTEKETGGEDVEVIVGGVIDGDVTKESSLLKCNDENWEESTCGEAISLEENRKGGMNFERGEIGEISLDFNTSTNSEEIETNDKPGKTEGSETPKDEKGELAKEINPFEMEESSESSRGSKSDDEEEDLSVGESSTEWGKVAEGDGDANGVGVAATGHSGSETGPPQVSAASPLPLSPREENENVLPKCAIYYDRGINIYEEVSHQVLPDVGKSVGPESVAKNENVAEGNGENSNLSLSKHEENFEQPFTGDDAAEDFTKNYSKQESLPGDFLIPSADSERPSEVNRALEAIPNASKFEKESNLQFECGTEEGRSSLESTECFEMDNFEGGRCSVLEVEMNSEEKQRLIGDARSENGSKVECSANDSSLLRKRSREISEIMPEDIRFLSLGSPRSVSPEGDLRKEEADCDSPSAQKAAKVVTEIPHSPEKDLGSSINVTNIFLRKPHVESRELSFASPCSRPREVERDPKVRSPEGEGRSGLTRELASTDLPEPHDVELEEGEIVDSSEDESRKDPTEKEACGNIANFVGRKVERRNSEEAKISAEKRQSRISIWFKRKEQSCPPAVRFTGKQDLVKLEMVPDVAMGEIPLPLGPAPRSSCFEFKKGMRLREESNDAEAKEKQKESISHEGVEVKRKESESKSPSCESPGRTGCPQKGPSLSPPVREPETSPLLAIFQRSSKIKFSFTRRSRWSKIGLNGTKEKGVEIISRGKPGEKVGEEKGRVDSDVSKEITTSDRAPTEQSLTTAERQSEEVRDENLPLENGREGERSKDEKDSKEHEKSSGQSEQLPAEDLEENIEVIGAMGDYMRDEFYECEDIPTSEDLTNGDDLETEKVNDDKFRNIMQNCLDNAKKFLNVGNLKLFSCSVDDLLELDCQAPDSALEEQEAQPNHISRDVLLASCEDTNDELALPENVQPPDLSMDFVPSFCSDVCPEILPVDNWPYLEEEVPSSPTKPKQDESDLMPPLEAAFSAFSTPDAHRQFHPKNGIDRRKRVTGEGCFKRFRRRSLITDGEAIRMCSKVGTQRRNTVDSFSGVPCGKEIRDMKSELMRWKTGKEDASEQTLKCCVSLEKLGSNQGVNFGFKSERVRKLSDDPLKCNSDARKKNGKSLDYKSPSWQPKVMLFRISKNELRKLRRETKLQRRSESKVEVNSAKREISTELENQHIPVTKKPKQVSDVEKVYVKVEREDGQVDIGTRNEEKLGGLSGLESIKGSLSVIPPTEERKRKRSRFRNLHTKRKTDLDTNKEVHGSAQKFPSTEPTLVDADAFVTEMFKDRDHSPEFQDKSTKQVIYFKNGEKPKKKSTESLPSGYQSQLPKGEDQPEKSVERAGPRTCGEEYLEQQKQRQRTKKKDGSHRDSRKEKEDHSKHKDGHKESDKGRTRDGTNHGRSSAGKDADASRRGTRDRSRSSSGGEAKGKALRETSTRDPWRCEVCGFSDVEERVTHIKSHPFHCQSCHLAFKTEAYFVSHLTKKHKNIRNQHHCLLCELSFDTEKQYRGHLETREHRHLESVEKNTINTLFTLLTGAPCPVLGLVESKPEWLPNQPGTVHFYHQATPLSLALQYLKMHHDLTSFSTVSSAHPK